MKLCDKNDLIQVLEACGLEEPQQWAALDKKYGAKLATITAMQYLKAMPERKNG